MKAIIVDDEERARRSLETLLAKYCPQVEVMEQCSDVPKAVLAINRHQPQVVFLDIEMPEYSGFELLQFFREPDFEIVFVTAYNDYAVRAFEVSAVDYLLKPVQIEQLKNAVGKLEQKLASHQMKARLETLAENLRADEIKKIALPVSDGLLFVEVANLVMLTADGAYTQVWLSDGSKLLVSKNLKFFEEQLQGRKPFFRVHRSHIIHLNFVRKYNRLESFLTMDNGTILAVSKERKGEFEEALEEIRGKK